MSYGYGGQNNPYDQRDAGYGAPARGGYGNQYGGQETGYSDAPYGGSVEMAPLAQNAGPLGGSDPNAILNECREISRGIDTIRQNLQSLRQLQQRTLDDADSSASSQTYRQLDGLSSETMALYRTLTDRVRTVKSNPDSRSAKNNRQVGNVDRSLKEAIQEYQQVESQFRKRTQEQMARQYRIVRPDATEQEVRQAVEDTRGGQIFSQAMMQSDRQGRARAALTAVQDRHDALVKIEQQMVELSQLFQDMDTLVIQQEAAVVQIEQKGEEVVENLGKGNEEIGVAVETAKSTRKKKWICLGISVAIIAIIVIVVVIYFAVIKNGTGGGGGGNNGQKRDTMEKAVMGFITPAPVVSRVMGRSVEEAVEVARVLRDRLHYPQMAS